MYVRANSTPASAPGGHVWEDETSVVEVPDHLGTELVRIAGQFSEVLPGDPDHPGLPADDLEPGDGDERDLLEPVEDPEDLLGEIAKKPCGKEGCGNNAKPGQDFCHWHKPKE